MAWGWSHTQEAYDNAYKNLHNESREFLEECYGEIQALGKRWHKGKPNACEEETPFYNSVYERAVKEAKKLPSDVLADYIWEFASNQATCTNGGHEAWMCPHGCGKHMVPFSLEMPNSVAIDEGMDVVWSRFENGPFPKLTFLWAAQRPGTVCLIYEIHGERYYEAMEFGYDEDSEENLSYDCGYVTKDSYHMGERYKDPDLWGPYFDEIFHGAEHYKSKDEPYAVYGG